MLSSALERSPMAKTDPTVISEFKAALNEAYGDRVARAVLYGSRARGNAKTDSDYDIAVFLKDLDNPADEFYPLAAIQIELLARTGAFIRAMPFAAGSWDHPSSPLMYEIRKDGLDL
jgi:predicted nucleotidyltransferase